MKKNNKIIFIILSFLIPFLSLSIIFFLKGLFTDKIILSGDMHAQYYPLFNYLKEVFNGNNSIFYSFNKSLGGTMFGTIFYYLSSPLNLILFFVNKVHIINFMTWLIILKISLCGLTMYLYMRHKYRQDNLVILTFSLCYAFMGYNINYFINIMWLDVVFMTPLLLIGIDKIIDGKSSLFYIITLFISIFSNYYITYMVCIFSVLYFIYEILLEYDIKKDKKRIKKISINFFLSSLLTGLMCSFFLIPCILEMLNYGRGVSLSEVFVFDYNFFDLFSKTYIGSLDLSNTLNYSSMNIYCGTVILPLVFLYFKNKRFKFKEKKLSLIFILLLIMPCFIGPLNYIWHLFTIPSFYSFRFSFLLCFLLINLAYKSFVYLSITKKDILLFLTFYLFISFYFILLTCFGNYYSFLNYKLIWISLLFLFIYIVLMFFVKKKYYIILLLTIIELIGNVSVIFYNCKLASGSELNHLTDIKNIIEKYSSVDSRIENNNYITYNDSILLNYNGVNNFLSTTNSKILKFIYHYGFSEVGTDYSNLYVNWLQNYMLDSILGMKYIIYKEKVENYKLIDQVRIDDIDYYVYDNPNSIGYGMMVKNSCNNLEEGNIYSEDIFNCLFDSHYNLYKEYKQEKDGSYILNEGNFYVYLDNILDSKFDELNKEISKNLIYRSQNYYIYNNMARGKIHFNFDDDMNISTFKVMYFDYNLFSSINYDKLNIEYSKNNYLKGRINANDDGILMVTLPYEKGFSIYVDGKKTNYFEVADAFIGLDLEKGHHTIEIKYKQPGLKVGIVVSIISCCVYCLYSRKWYDGKSIL